MSIEKLNAIDRIPYNVLSNGAIKYGIYDTDENLIRYEYIKKHDEPIEEGTKVNKQLFDTIDSNFEYEETERKRVDRFNEAEVDKGNYYVECVGDLIPKTWTKSGNYQYYATDNSNIIIRSSDYSSSSYLVDKAFDSDETTYFYVNISSGYKKWIQIQFEEAIEITGFKIKATGIYSADSYQTYILGSNDESNWTTLHTIKQELAELSEVKLDNTGIYKYYRIQVEKTSGSSSHNICFYAVQTMGYKTTKECNLLKVNLDTEEYFDGQIVNFKIPLLAKTESFSSSIIPVMKSEKQDGFKITSSGVYSSSYYDYSAFDGDTSKVWVSNEFTSSEEAWIMIETPFYIKPTTIYLSYKYFGSKREIRGLNQNNQWEVIANLSTSSTSQKTETLTINTNNFYKAFRIVSNQYSSSYDHLYLYEFQIRTGEKSAFSDGTLSFLKLGNLEEKQVETIIKEGSKQSVVYDEVKGIFKTEGNGGSKMSIKTGTISNGAIIPKTEGFSNYLYFVSLSSGSASTTYSVKTSTSATYTVISGTIINCSVDQKTRKVTCTVGNGSSTVNATANYIEIAWN